MKRKILASSVIFIMALFLCVSSVYATIQFNVEAKSNKTQIKNGEILEVVLKAKDFTKSEKGINVIVLTVEYDKGMFKTLKTEDLKGLNGWETPTFNPANGMLIIESSSIITSDQEFLKITFRTENNVESKETKIKIKEISSSDGEKDIFPKDVEVTVNIVSDYKDDGTNAGTNGENSNIDNTNNNQLNNNGNTLDKDNLGAQAENGKATNWILVGAIVVAAVALIAGSVLIVIKKNKSKMM